MYRELNKNEVEEFTKKHFSIWNGDIKSISCIEYNNIKEYLMLLFTANYCFIYKEFFKNINLNLIVNNSFSLKHY